MQQYYDLEISILSCLLQKPKLMEELKLEDKHFIRHQRLWQFMKTFYSKFETFDICLMYNLCSDKYQISKCLEWLVDADPIILNFDKYQQLLIEKYNQSKKERWIKNKIIKLNDKLLLNDLKIEDYQEKINIIFENANKIFEEDK